MILDKMKIKNKRVLTKAELENWLAGFKTGVDKDFGNVLVTAGAGDIDTLVEKIRETLNR
jgi:UDP-N-acetylmuramate--alanine ligase